MQCDPAKMLSTPPSCSRKETYRCPGTWQPVVLEEKHFTASLEQLAGFRDIPSLIVVGLFVSGNRRT
jgi:hypothetical protein